MTEPLPHRIATAAARAAAMYHRLVLVVGGPRSGKTTALAELSEERGWPRLNVNLELSEHLLDLTRKQRAIRAPRILAQVVDGSAGEVVLLDNLELLFSPELAQDPLRLLQGLSRNRTLVAAWSGGFDGTYLTYAAPGHPEARRYDRPEALVVTAAPIAPIVGTVSGSQAVLPGLA